MTDSEKMDLLLAEMQSMKAEMQSMKTEMCNMSSRIDSVETQVKQTERVLKNEIRKECALVLDEVERVHSILDKHKADTTKHTA